MVINQLFDNLPTNNIYIYIYIDIDNLCDLPHPQRFEAITYPAVF